MCDVCIPIIPLSVNLYASKQCIHGHLSSLTIVQLSRMLPPLSHPHPQHTLYPLHVHELL